ncbi:TIGR02391 family protein [Nocardioides sp. IC4_145]|uniref:TIGR02391 family protein n=1 Tax=Nocardioides sp. IC4_145 TaxID=2714037 RepID=UPI0024186CFD|nr:TIGR02391 family protein [Nocardioides sp. IC4_145]
MRAANRYGSASPTDELCGYVDAAAVLASSASPASAAAPGCDPVLWDHVGGLVASGMWDLVPSAVVTFVEDWIRRHAGSPPNKKGGKLYGAGLFAAVLRPGSAHALGEDASEQEGWQLLGQGLAKAIGNSSRHDLRERADAEVFAWGVIGLGSLLIAEMRSTLGSGQGRLPG